MLRQGATRNLCVLNLDSLDAHQLSFASTNATQPMYTNNDTYHTALEQYFSSFGTIECINIAHTKDPPGTDNRGLHSSIFLQSWRQLVPLKQPVVTLDLTIVACVMARIVVPSHFSCTPYRHDSSRRHSPLPPSPTMLLFIMRIRHHLSNNSACRLTYPLTPLMH